MRPQAGLPLHHPRRGGRGHRDRARRRRDALTEADASAAGFARSGRAAGLDGQEGRGRALPDRHPAGRARSAGRPARHRRTRRHRARRPDRRLDRMDRAADQPGPGQALEQIARHPGVVSTELAAAAGQERAYFKLRVRRLKALGLTESLEVGYRLSPRGAGVLCAVFTSRPESERSHPRPEIGRDLCTLHKRPRVDVGTARRRVRRALTQTFRDPLRAGALKGDPGRHRRPAADVPPGAQPAVEHGSTRSAAGALAEAAGVNSAQLRKDLSYLGSYGTRGVGYDVALPAAPDRPRGGLGPRLAGDHRRDRQPGHRPGQLLRLLQPRLPGGRAGRPQPGSGRQADPRPGDLPTSPTWRTWSPDRRGDRGDRHPRRGGAGRG